MLFRSDIRLFALLGEQRLATRLGFPSLPYVLHCDANLLDSRSGARFAYVGLAGVRGALAAFDRSPHVVTSFGLHHPPSFFQAWSPCCFRGSLGSATTSLLLCRLFFAVAMIDISLSE